MNQSFVQRLGETALNDANLNALVKLDTFASVILMSIDYDKMDDLEALFESYF